MTDENELQDIFKKLQDLQFLKEFPEQLVHELAQITTKQVFAQGAIILEQGQKNENLFILQDGVVEVIVDGEPVTKLSGGEMIGEMSVILQSHVSATVRALSEVKCYRIHAPDFGRIKPEQQTLFLYLLNRAWARILAARVEITNDKARRFEIANRELKKTHEQLQELSTVIISELGETTDTTLRTIYDLQEHQFAHLIKGLKALELSADSEDATKISKVVASMNEVSQALQPLSQLYVASRALRGKRVLLLDGAKKQQMIAKMALGGTGIEITIAFDHQSCAEALTGKKFDLILCSEKLVELAGVVRKFDNLAPILMTSMKNIFETMASIENQNFVQNLVLCNEDDRSSLVRGYNISATKILTKDPFGLTKYLSRGIELREEKIVGSAQRANLIEKVKSYFQGLGVRKMVIERAAVSLEEMLMNAIYDAPVDSQGSPVYNHMARTAEISLDPNQYGTLTYACDGVWLGVSVSDPFGSFSLGTLRSYLSRCYSGHSETQDGGKGGAGRGLHLLIENADQTVINVIKKAKTEVICLFHLEMPTNKADIHPLLQIFFN